MGNPGQLAARREIFNGLMVGFMSLTFIKSFENIDLADIASYLPGVLIVIFLRQLIFLLLVRIFGYVRWVIVALHLGAAVCLFFFVNLHLRHMNRIIGRHQLYHLFKIALPVEIIFSTVLNTYFWQLMLVNLKEKSNYSTQKLHKIFDNFYRNWVIGFTLGCAFTAYYLNNLPQKMASFSSEIYVQNFNQLVWACCLINILLALVNATLMPCEIFQSLWLSNLTFNFDRDRFFKKDNVFLNFLKGQVCILYHPVIAAFILQQFHSFNMFSTAILISIFKIIQYLQSTNKLHQYIKYIILILVVVWSAYQQSLSMVLMGIYYLYCSEIELLSTQNYVKSNVYPQICEVVGQTHTLLLWAYYLTPASYIDNFMLIYIAFFLLIWGFQNSVMKEYNQGQRMQHIEQEQNIATGSLVEMPSPDNISQ